MTGEKKDHDDELIDMQPLDGHGGKGILDDDDKATLNDFAVKVRMSQFSAGSAYRFYGVLGASMIIVVAAIVFLVNFYAGKRDQLLSPGTQTTTRGETVLAPKQEFVSPLDEFGGEVGVSVSSVTIQLSVRNLPSGKVRLNFVAKDEFSAVREYICEPVKASQNRGE